MFKKVAGALLCALGIVLPGSAAGEPSLAVLPLRGTINSNFLVDQDQINSAVTSAFLNTRRFTMVERSQLGAVLNEGKFQNSGLVDDATAVALGKQLGVKYVVVGSCKADSSPSREVSGTKLALGAGLAHFGFKNKREVADSSETQFWQANIKVSLRMVEVATGKIENAFEASGDARTMNRAKSAKEATDKLEANLMAKVKGTAAAAQTGYVIKVYSPGELMIDLGSSHGLAADSRVQVCQREDDIVHPVTGKTIRGKKVVLGTYRVKSLDEDTSVVVAEGSAPRSIKAGQIVEVVTSSR
ncbi:CsgG/HfaB family protein [Holophaga foetida]|uniref:CsgG/HfaB family protein n=1 Tax=Holophaga foetida TaxID=35839 RepID=UPI0002475364|nr:CsgG/HfaB family protein [Holophaga foetida]